MTKKNKLILCLIAVAAVLFYLIQFWILPAIKARGEEYTLRQTDALTHDITAVEKFKNPYLGNVSNTTQLFYALPLNNVPMKFQIDSDTCTLTVNYLDTVWNIGEETVQRDLVYNSIAAMAAIDNLSGITYAFSGDSYTFTRARLEEILGAPLSALLDKETWAAKVQDRISSESFCRQFFEQQA